MRSTPGSWARRAPQEAWRDREPIRAEIFDTLRFRQHARSLADSQTVVEKTPPVVPMLTRLRLDEETLSKAYVEILDDVSAGRPITPAAEWIIDNFHVVEEHIRTIRRDLPPDYFRQLPKLGQGVFLAGHPRIMGIVWAYVAHTDSLFDPTLLATYIRAYEARRALTLGELWAVAIVLRLLLLENLRRLAVRIVDASRDRRWAEQVADQLLGADGRPPRQVAGVIPRAGEFLPSRSFAVRLAQRLFGQDAHDAMAWLEERLAVQGTDLEATMLAEHHAQSAASVTMRNIFTSLREITHENWEDWVERVSMIEKELRAAPGYAELDFLTRNRYRSAVETLARDSGQREVDVARRAVHEARVSPDEVTRDLGYWLIDRGHARLRRSLGISPSMRERIEALRRWAGVTGYVAVLTVLTIGVLTLLALLLAITTDAAVPAWWWITMAVLAGLPASDFALGILNLTVAHDVQAHPLPSLALRDGVPEHLRTLVVIPSLLTDDGEVDELIDRLETHYLANVDEQVHFALVTDWPDAEQERDVGDEALLARARAGIARLNETYEAKFLLFHRPRLFNPSEGVWMGEERKRGKLHELNQLLAGSRQTHLAVVEGAIPGPFRYVLTLDSDTQLPRNAARHLVGKMAHPLNKVRLDPGTGRVLRGYGILQPRVVPSLPSGETSTVIQRAYSGRRGLDPYAFAISDVYQDLFGEGSFTGKGLYDIEVMNIAVDDRLPINRVLSHDLLEGNYARSGLVTDVEVVEEHPSSYAVMADRSHRWIRGDWQLLPWILWRHDGLSRLGIWKMADNLRRSLVAPAIVATTLFVAATRPAADLAMWLGVVAAIFYFPLFLGISPSRLIRTGDTTRRSRWVSLMRDLGQGLELATLNITFVGHQAWLHVDAILRTLTRLLVTRRHLLEWKTAAASARGSAATVSAYYRRMAGGLLAPVALAVIAAAQGLTHLLVATAPVVAWLLAPAVAAWASVATPADTEEATDQERREIRLIARRTWRFFDELVTPEHHHLPPDNLQEDPHEVVAPRTSPTNIGLHLLSMLSARDLGWLGLGQAVERLQATLTTLQGLERHRGHFYNWYDTRTCQPLPPRYVSTVDSGNLAGHLLTVAATAREYRDEVRRGPLSPIPHGLDDTLAILQESLREAVGHSDAEATSQAGWYREATTRLEDLRKSIRQRPEGETDIDWKTVHQHAKALRDGIASAEVPGDEVGAWAAAALRGARGLCEDASADEAARQRIANRLEAVASQAEQTALAMDFTFLHDRRRSLMSIGHHVDSGSTDDSCFDLLASEARLASYVAIAKGDVRSRHWRLLGRPVTPVGNRAALQSWTGSMFEYLMPTLIMRPPLGSLLERTEELVVRKQIAYTEPLGIPWGISESAYNGRDAEYTYQYSPFGVPGLGIMRGLADSMVIAPYATGLALMIDPTASLQNYAWLDKLGARGRYGFYEALDFTPSRVPKDEQYVVVRAYMAHHQGMTVVAANNALNHGIMRTRFHSVPQVRATELLLQEQAPREVPRAHRRRTHAPITRRVIRDLTTPEEQVFHGPETLTPTIAHWSNGALSLTLTPAGGGQLRWQGSAITRWHPDPTTEEAGDHIYLHDEKQGRSWSATPMPLLGSALNVETRFSDDRATFLRQSGPFETDLEYRLDSERGALGRRLTVRNLHRREQRLTVTSYAELVLAPARDDDAHPAFSKMFVETEYDADRQALVAHRRKRKPSDADVWVAQIVVTDAATIGSPGYETDRGEFLGAGHTVRNPRQVLERRAPTGSVGHPLDPILSQTRRVRLPASGEIHLDYWTLVAGSRSELLALVDAHRGSGAWSRVAQLSWIQTQVQQRHLGITAKDVSTFRQLAGLATYPVRPAREVTRNDSGAVQSRLWPLSISGDVPIVVMRVSGNDDLAPVRELVQAFEYWRLRRCSVDVVLLNDEKTSYFQETQHTLETLVGGIRPRTANPDSVGQLRVVLAEQTEPEVLANLVASAAVVLHAGSGPLAGQLTQPSVPTWHGRRLPQAGRLRAAERTEQPGEPGRGHEELRLDNGYGGFSADGREYVVVLDEGVRTPAPWSNVIANEQLGFLTTAEGAGSTWWRNSRDNQLTPWRNDPVSRQVSEALYVRDDSTGTVMTPTAAPVAKGRHLTRHGFGYTVHSHSGRHLDLRLTHFVAGEDAAKESVLEITNRSGQERSVTITSYHETVLGQLRQQTWPHLVSWCEERTGALAFTNPWSSQYADQVVLVDLAGEQTSLTADRTEVLGQQGTTESPAAVQHDRALSGRTGSGLDPCAALRRTLQIPAQGTVRVRVILVAGHTEDEAVALLERRRAADPARTLADVRAVWEQRLGQIRVKTPEPSFDLVMNGWMLYQSYACRMLARTGYYQASGAFGFRDQLQDGMAIVLIDPAIAREHLLRAAGRQFIEGDVQHWWLPADGAGIRTRISDDVVWLAAATARYISVTGDIGVLDERVSWLQGDPLAPDEDERFFLPAVTEESATLWDHVRKALEQAFRYGRHGLPLMGTGDWNDGMNRVGAGGEGESVWLGWFLHATLTDAITLADAFGDAEFSARCAAEQVLLRESLETHGWDGEWYRRGYFDDGTPLGSATRPECQIDAIAQSWAVLSGAAHPERAAQAMDSSTQRLVLPAAGVARLFTPPFTSSEPDPGYVRSYPPGIRENGGQYTHGCIWSIFAHASLGRADRAGDLFALMNPINHARSQEAADRYRTEPYVLAADVYSVEPHLGRGGWTWYTGSSGWFFRAGLEAVLGVRREAGHLALDPCMPPEWETARVTWQIGTATYDVCLETDPRPGGPPEAGWRRQVVRTTLDGHALDDPARVPVSDDGRHHEVSVLLRWEHVGLVGADAEN